MSKSETNAKCKIKMFQNNYSDFLRMAPKMSMSSVLSWINFSRSMSSAASSLVSRSRNQYRVSFDSFLEILIRIRKSFVPNASFASNIIRSDGTR